MKKSKSFFIDYFAANLVKTLFKLGKSEIRNWVNLPDESCIMAFNHVSYLDWIIVYTMFYKEMNKKIDFIGKKRLFEHWLFKHLMEFGNVICVDQEKVGKEFLASVKRTLKEGNILGIFPRRKTLREWQVE